MSSLPLKFLPPKKFCRLRKRWKSDGAKSWEYGGCGKTSQLSSNHFCKSHVEIRWVSWAPVNWFELANVTNFFFKRAETVPFWYIYNVCYLFSCKMRISIDYLLQLVIFNHDWPSGGASLIEKFPDRNWENNFLTHARCNSILTVHITQFIARFKRISPRIQAKKPNIPLMEFRILHLWKSGENIKYRLIATKFLDIEMSAI